MNVAQRYNRKIGVVSRDGRLVRYTTLAEVQASLYKAKRIELEVDDSTRPSQIMCECGRIFAVSNRGRVPQKCHVCRNPTLLKKHQKYQNYYQNHYRNNQYNQQVTLGYGLGRMYRYMWRLMLSLFGFRKG